MLNDCTGNGAAVDSNISQGMINYFRSSFYFRYNEMRNLQVAFATNSSGRHTE